MATDFFLFLQNVDGESRDVTYEKQIHMHDFHWGLQQSGSTHTGTGSGAGRVAVQDISFTMDYDKSVPVLMGFCCSGEHIEKGEMTARKAGGDKPVDFFKITLEDILISSVNISGSGHGDDALSVSVSLNFGKFTSHYKVQDQKGVAKETVKQGWDIPANKVKVIEPVKKT